MDFRSAVRDKKVSERTIAINVLEEKISIAFTFLIQRRLPRKNIDRIGAGDKIVSVRTLPFQFVGNVARHRPDLSTSASGCACVGWAWEVGWRL